MAYINGNQILFGAINSEAPAYGKIAKYTVTQADFDAGYKAYQFGENAETSGTTKAASTEIFSLSSMVIYGDNAAATGTGSIEVAIYRTSSFNTVYKNNTVLSTTANSIKISLDLKGYWTVESVIGSAGLGGTVATVQGMVARNKVTNKAELIQITSNIVIPVGTKIEIFGY